MKIVTSILVITQLTAVLSHADILFKDSFGRSNSDIINERTTSIGQEGLAAPLTYGAPTDRYFKDESFSAVSNGRLRMCNGNNASVITLKSHNFIDSTILKSKGFSLSINVLANRKALDKNNSNNYVGFGIGMSERDIDERKCITDLGNPGGGPRGDFFGAPSGTADFYTSWTSDNGGSIQIFTRDKTKGFQYKAMAPYGGILRADFRFDTFAAGAPVSAEIYMNNKFIGRTSFTWSQSNKNYISLSANQSGNFIEIDNLTIQTKGTPSETVSPATTSAPKKTAEPKIDESIAPGSNWSKSKTPPQSVVMSNQQGGGALNVDWFNKAGIYSRSLGQSFKTDKPITVRSVTIKLESSHTFDSRKHVLQLAMLKGSSTTLGKTVIGKIGEYDLATSTLDLGDYLTFILPEPVTITPDTLHHFELFWTSPDLSHSMQVSYTPNAAAFREGDAYSRAGGTFFPVGSSLVKMPSQDLTFYLLDKNPKEIAGDQSNINLALNKNLTLPGTTVDPKTENTPKETPNLLPLLGLIPVILLLLLRQSFD